MNPRAINAWKPNPTLANRLEQAKFNAMLPQSGRDYVDATIALGPSRQVQGRMGNNTFTYFSTKTQSTLRLESRRGEQAMAVLLDHDPNVIAFFAQPPEVTLKVEREDGTVATTKRYTPDFLVVDKDRVRVIETKDTVALLEKAERNAFQFYRDTAGTWHHRAAETYFHELNIEFELKATSDLPPALIGNLRFLEDYTAEGCPPLAQEEADAVLQKVQDSGSAHIHAMISEGVPADHIYRAIVEGHVYFDLQHDALSAVESSAVYANKAMREMWRRVEAEQQCPPPPIPGTLHLRSGCKVQIYGVEYTVGLEGEHDVRLIDRFGREEVRTLAEIDALKRNGAITGPALRTSNDPRQLDGYSEAKIMVAREKLDAIESGSSSRYSDRSLNRFKRQIVGALNVIDKLVALIDKSADKGNRQPRISELNLNLIEKAIEQGYNTPRQQTKKGAYAKYLGLCNGVTHEDGSEAAVQPTEVSGAPVHAVSYQTFCIYCTLYHDVNKREGRRSAYQNRAIVTSLDNGYPTHGVRPHDVCEIDHTVANIALKSPNGLDLGKPTLTVAIDTHSCSARALVVSFRAPCAATVLLLLRDYVRRNKRLPRVLVLDNGKEFRGHELEYFCRLYGIELRFRSPGMPRGAATVERSFGSIEEEVFSEMSGNTRIMKENTRLVTKSVDPFRQAEWTIVAVYAAIEQYLFDVRQNRVHPSLGVTPHEFEARSLQSTGLREFRMFTLDENMMLMTCPHPKRPTRKIIRGRGVNVNGIYYRNAAFDRLRPNTSVEVRVEPYNASVVYVNLGDRWVAATGNSSRWLCQRTHYEVEAALREEQRVMQLNAKRDGVSLKSLQHKMRPLQPSDFDPRIAAQQDEMCELYESLGMATALKDVPTALRAKRGGDEKVARPATPPQDADRIPPAAYASAPPPADPVAEAKPLDSANQRTFADTVAALFRLR